MPAPSLLQTTTFASEIHEKRRAKRVELNRQVALAKRFETRESRLKTNRASRDKLAEKYGLGGATNGTGPVR